MKRNIGYKQRLAELWINPWIICAKHKYASSQEGESIREFIQPVPGRSFLPNPIKPSLSRGKKQKGSAHGVVAVSIELKTATSPMM